MLTPSSSYNTKCPFAPVKIFNRKADAMGSFQLKGKQQEVELYSVYLSGNTERRRRRGLFRKKIQELNTSGS